ncbi:MAG: response regulator [Candidatus Gastranaerophilales bacterium]|nr:response regulator [Candidatus Gastranaerophilales bacterium]
MNITEEQLSKIFELASMENKLSSKEITEADITEALIEIERKLYSFSSEIKIDSLEDKKILIADDLELSIYQLSTVLKKIGITPVVARHKEEAISELNKVRFDCVIFDLFIPGSSDGIDLIKAAVEKRKENNSYFKIIVISGTDDESLIDLCYESGADFYIQKDKDWHSKLIKYISTSFKTDTNIAFTRYIINNNIVSYIVKRFNDSKVFDTIVKNVNSSIYTGLKNILFDMKEITTFDVDNAYIFADIYKLCAENGGIFVLVNPSLNVKEALSFAYLEDIIPYSNSIEDAVALISEKQKTVSPQ